MTGCLPCVSARAGHTAMLQRISQQPAYSSCKHSVLTSHKTERIQYKHGSFSESNRYSLLESTTKPPAAPGWGSESLTISQSFPLLPTCSQQVSRVFIFTWSHSHTTVGRTPLDEGSAHRRDLYLTTQTLYRTNIHAPGGIRTHDPSKRSAADLRLRRRGHWDRRL
jgi:hypothetical protein